MWLQERQEIAATPGACVSSTEPRPHHDCDKLDKPCRRHRRETPVCRIKIKHFHSANTVPHLSSPKTRRCFPPTMARTIARLRPLCFAKWDRIFYFSGQRWSAMPRLSPKGSDEAETAGWPVDPVTVWPSCLIVGAWRGAQGCGAETWLGDHTLRGSQTAGGSDLKSGHSHSLKNKEATVTCIPPSPQVFPCEPLGTLWVISARDHRAPIQTIQSCCEPILDLLSQFRHRPFRVDDAPERGSHCAMPHGRSAR